MLDQIIKDSGETRTVWAERIGVSNSYLSDLLNGHKQPSLNLAARIERLTAGAVPASSWVPLPPTPAEAPPQPPSEDAA